MAQKGNYTLKNREYYEALKIISEEFERKGIKYALVGGAGIQARISDLHCKAQKTDISGANGLESLLRQTKDFDITSNASEEEFTNYFNELQALNQNVNIKHERARSKQMKVLGKNSSTVSINYQTGFEDFIGLNEEFYTECLNTAKPLILKYGGTKFEVYVANPECLIASKLTRNDPKDIWDIGALMKTIKMYKSLAGKFSQNKVEKHLKNSGRGEIIGRFNEIKEQILKE